MNIGVFDSGIGGITVLNEIIKLLPKEHFIYYSDSKNNPYGIKTKKEIFEISEQIVEFLLKKKCDVIVIACNTASAAASYDLRKKYNSIPILAIEPAFKVAYDYNKNGKTLIMATKYTIESEKFKKLLEKYDNNNALLLSCAGLPELIEGEKIKDIDEYLEKNLKKYRGKIENVVLGCTHFPLIKDNISKVLDGNVRFFDGAEGLARNLEKIVKQRQLKSNNRFDIEFFDSSESEKKKERFFKYLIID